MSTTALSPLKGRKVLIFAGPDFEDSELIYPKYRFREAGADVTVAGLGDSVYKGKKGATVEVDRDINNCINTSWDIVIIPGGWAPDKIRMNDNALKIVQDAVKREAVVASICHGPWVLASAKVIGGRQVTSYKAIKDDLIHAGGQWSDQAVVVDGPIITSRTPDDLPEFCQAIIEVASRVKTPA